MSQEKSITHLTIGEVKYIHYAVFSALVVGLTFTLNMVTIKHLLERFHFDPIQLNYDVNLIYGLILMPFLAYDLRINGFYPL
jgi:hypothetical protein